MGFVANITIVINTTNLLFNTNIINQKNANIIFITNL